MTHFFSLRKSLIGFVLLVLSALASAQNTWYVDVQAAGPGSGTQASPYKSIQYGITRPSTLSGDTLLVAPGTYVENLVDYPKRVVVRATAGALLTELRPLAPLVATVYWTEGSTLEGFKLTGNASIGINGGALNFANGTALRCIVRDNSGQAVYSAIATLRGCTIVENGRGILVEFFSTVVLQNTIVWSNQLFDVAGGGLGTFADYSAGGIPAGSIGVGNIFGAPGVWELAGARHHLRPGSACIDTGDPNSPLDPDGTRADIGAIPFDPNFAPAPANYCSGKLNSQGCVPTIGSVGTASATSPAAFTIHAINETSQKNGLLFFGFGKRAQAFQGGLHCIALPTKRVGAQNSQGAAPCSGSFSLDMRAYIQSSIHPGLVAGALVYCQWWNRDPLDPAGFGTGLTDALSFGIAP